MLNQSIDTIESFCVDSSIFGRDLGNTSSWEITGVVSDEDIAEEKQEEEDDDDNNSQGATGILILPRAESRDNVRERHPQQVNSPMSLSVPDSVPSNVGSLIINQQAALQQPLLQERAATGSSSTGAFLDLERKQVVRVALVISFFTVLCFTPMMYLLWERHEFRSTTLHLQEEIRILQEQVKKNKPKLKLRPPDPVRPPPPSTFSWESKPTNCDSNPPNKVVDNCWVRAQANFELGDCAVETQKKVKKKLKNLGQSIWRAQEEFFVKIKDVKSQFPDAYFDSSSPDGTTGTKHNTPQVQQVVKYKDKMQKIGKVATSILSGVAFASAAALIVSGTFISRVVSDNDSDQN